METFRYTAFGLSILSELPCPELGRPTRAQGSDPDVRIIESDSATCGSLPQNAPCWFDAKPGLLRFRIDGVGRFEVSEGHTVRFARGGDVPASRVSDADVRVFLLGSCLGAILQQRGILALHASSASIHGTGIAFVGPSGVGKSTALAAMLDDGGEMLSDDVSAVGRTNDTVAVQPAYGQLKLNADTVDHFGIDADELRWINRFRSKRALPMPERLCRAPVPLSAIFSLEPSVTSRSIEIADVRGAERFALVYRNAYRQAFHEGLGVRDEMVARAAQVASRCALYRLKRPASGALDTDAVIGAVREALGSRAA